MKMKIEIGAKEFAEKFPHDVCPKCGCASIPAEKVPDQTLRGCPDCGEVLAEDLSRAATQSVTVPGAKAKHTPGQWRIGELDKDLTAYRIYGGGTGLAIPAVALAAGSNAKDAMANACLIAAAPDLLAALEILVDGCEGIVSQQGSLQDSFFQPGAMAKAHAAIAKARGEN